MWVEIHFFQTPINVGIWPLLINHECSLMASKLVNSFQRFSIYLPRSNSIRGISIHANYSFKICISSIIRLETQNCSLIMACRVDYVLGGIKTALILLYISISALGWQGQWAVILWKASFFFSWEVDLNGSLKISSKTCCKEKCYHPGIVPLTEHRQSRFSIIFKGLRTFRIINEHWLHFKVTSCISL